MVHVLKLPSARQARREGWRSIWASKRPRIGFFKPAEGRAGAEPIIAEKARIADRASDGASGAVSFDLHQRALDVLDQLLEGGASEQAAWFAAMGAKDPALANQVALLLRADRAGGKFLPTDLPSPTEIEGAAPPDHVGPYKLVSRLGSGGMGDVYLGVRDDDLFDQTVAIKIIKPGLMSPQLMQRFADERRILAKLKHPHIAQLFDGGLTIAGHSYIVMEHLSGDTIRDYIVKGRLPLTELLKLFIDVCSAVQFAHENLVVHADIKPSNIIVTENLGVKLLDFGISRFLVTEDEELAAPRQSHPMTKAYAAPERILGSKPSVGGDVYALGALLYEMLVGNETDHATTPDVPAGDLPNLARPKRPSVALRANPGLSVVKSREVEGDLDAIVQKALSTRLSDRYTSVAQLSNDIYNYQRGVPVRARPDVWQYRSLKFIGRHKRGLSATAISLLVLAVLAGAMTAHYFDSEHARANAVKRFNETRTMANFMLFDVDPELARLPGSLDLRRKLVSSGQTYLKVLQKDPNAPPDIKIEVAKGYLRLARIYAYDVSGGLGDLPAANAALQQALAILNTIPARPDEAPDLQLARADAIMVQTNYAFVSPAPGSVVTMQANLLNAIAKYRAILIKQPGSVDATLGLRRAQIMLGRIMLYVDSAHASTSMLNSVDQVAPPAAMSADQRREWDYLEVAGDLVIGEIFEERQMTTISRRYWTALVTDVAKFRRAGISGLEFDFVQATGMTALAELAANRGHFPEAFDLNERALATLRRILSYGPNDAVEMAISQEDMGFAKSLAAARQFGRAAALAKDAVSIIEKRQLRDASDKGAERILGLYLTREAEFELDDGRRNEGCMTAKRNWAVWQAALRSSGAMPMDLKPGGVIELVEKQLAACGVHNRLGDFGPSAAKSGSR